MNSVRKVAQYCALALLTCCGAVGAAEELEFRPPASPLDPGAAAVMRDLAVRVLPVYEEKNPERFLTNLSAIQVIAGHYGPAAASLQSLRERRKPGDSARADGTARVFDIYIRALDVARERRAPFAQSFTQAFHETVTPLSDLEAFTITGWRLPQLRNLERELEQRFALRSDRRTIELSEAVELLYRYFLFDAGRKFEEPLQRLISEDDQRRYVFDSVRIPGPAGNLIAAVIARPRNAPKPLPALLEFTVLLDPLQPITEPAAHGYAGVRAFTRGRQAAAARVIPFQHDGADARVVIQ
ncbi:MAG: hypothetical protein ABIT36_03075, partial [Steroidobacteraceae bacterium]